MVVQKTALVMAIQMDHLRVRRGRRSAKGADSAAAVHFNMHDDAP